MALLVKLYQTLEEEITPSQRKAFHDLGRWGHFPTQVMRTLLPWYQNQINTLQEKKNTDQYPSWTQMQEPLAKI